MSRGASKIAQLHRNYTKATIVVIRFWDGMGGRTESFCAICGFTRRLCATVQDVMEMYVLPISILNIFELFGWWGLNSVARSILLQGVKQAQVTVCIYLVKVLVISLFLACLGSYCGCSTQLSNSLRLWQCLIDGVFALVNALYCARRLESTGDSL